jgi:TolB-like protein/DNA-binding SARP family transcriptional activator/Tfp pilus assembly protein PilF
VVGPADDTVLGDSGHQRRRLALLAVLAVSGEEGRSRDQLLGLFWPEVPQSRARHSLEQLLYAIRSSLDENVFTGANPLRLNWAVINSDIGDFNDALARGDREGAVRLYRGPFLEGFYLSDAPAFEQWMDAERGRIERSFIEALERLAKNSENANDAAAAARWRQKLIETDPLSSKHAIGLIRALVNAGDHASALKYAQQYETIVGQELGTSVGAAVAGLVAEVRQRAKAESVLIRSNAGPPASPEPNGSPAKKSARVARDAAPRQNEPATARTGGRRRLASVFGITAIALGALVLAAWLRSRAAPDPVAVSTAPSIAVLPLANVSGNPADAPVADGLSEDLIGVLSKIDRLRVVARTSAFAFKNTNLDVRRIADSLHVSNILEGSVQRDSHNIRVQVRLIDARDGSTRWSETYNRELKDIFLVQSEIAASVARELDLRLGGRSVAPLQRPPTQNIAAYELYLRGNDPVLARGDSSTLLAQQYFKQAIALDSTFAGAYAGLARSYLRLLLGQRALPSSRQLYVLAKEAALKAVALNDSMAEGHSTVGELLMVGYDLAGAEIEFKRAVALDPHALRTLQKLITLYEWEGRPADALAEAKLAVENDPLSAGGHTELARALCASGQYAQGLAWLTRLEAVRPPLLRLPLYGGICQAMQQHWPAAIESMRRSRQNRGRGLLAYALARGGNRREALTLLTELKSHAERTNQGAFEVAVVHAGLGNRDEAFEWLNRSIDDLSLSENIMLPIFDDLHADPRFRQLRARLGLQNP